jgi:hypothetical protein
VHHRVESAELLQGREELVERRPGDIAGQDDRALELGRQLANAGLHALALVREREAHPGRREGLRAGPGDRSLVGDAEDESGLAFEDPLQRETPWKREVDRILAKAGACWKTPPARTGGDSGECRVSQGDAGLAAVQP